jgi:acyl-CoA synthetase (AMP-forming)/AMP-acid ligase II
VVVALPDPRKGEQIVLITEKSDADRDALLAHARQQGFPELWVPKAILVAGAGLGKDRLCGRRGDGAPASADALSGKIAVTKQP